MYVSRDFLHCQIASAFAVLAHEPKRVHRAPTVLNDGEDMEKLQGKVDSALELPLKSAWRKLVRTSLP
jgi:hypothetical protein